MILTVQYNVCPKCGKSFEKLIIITDNSKTPPDKFYGCPCCYSKLETSQTNSMKKIEKKIKVIETKSGDECPKYFGYLADHFCEEILPKECLDCKKMTDCMKSTNKTKNDGEKDFETQIF
ncbi:MAG: hypothetical protein OQK81_00360 [Candidatus Bathyarchaeota archaeon]|nr:hypothetical protein [Candidatus Bathyarchaeota archaeon]